MIVLLLIVSFANTTPCGAQNPAAQSNQAATNKAPVLIDVEVRFVELSKDALNQFDAEWSSGSKPETNNSQASTRQDNRIDSNSAALRISTQLTGSWTVFTASEVACIENVMGCNLLAAPRVTTLSGKNAEIKVVREIIYPATYKMQTVVVDKKSGQIRRLSTNEFVSTSNHEVFSAAIPEYTTRETGVIFNVTPTATVDGKTINLIMNPQIVELVEWIDYGSMLRSANGSDQQVKMFQPVFRSRKLSSQITILDGQTVVMGGLITETRVDDKGSWFSRWFGSKPERKTLLVMVTARCVDLAGKPFSQSQP